MLSYYQPLIGLMDENHDRNHKEFRVAIGSQNCLAMAILTSPASADQTLKKFRPNYKAVLMADADTEEFCLRSKHRKAYPASLVKLMSVLLTFEA